MYDPDAQLELGTAATEAPDGDQLADTACDAVPNKDPVTFPEIDAVMPAAEYCNVGVKYEAVYEALAQLELGTAVTEAPDGAHDADTA